LHPSQQAGRGPRFGNDRKKGKGKGKGNDNDNDNDKGKGKGKGNDKGKGGYAISFELRVSSCE
jgi:hypothetical protein